MCRFLAYRGDPVFLADLVYAPAHSLVRQSLHAAEAEIGAHGDGFGVGWYGERAEPGLYRDPRPAWSDENLKSLCEQVRSRAFFAHVRASTGAPTARANCHPFVHGRWLFMHNGQIGGYARLKRRIEALIPDALYDARQGSTDSEAIFLIALALGLGRNPVGAVAHALEAVRAQMAAAAVAEPLRFTAALTDGRSLYAFRYACDGRPPSLYYRETGGGLIVASEPIDGLKTGWRQAPKGCALVARASRPLAVEPLGASLSSAA